MRRKLNPASEKKLVPDTLPVLEDWQVDSLDQQVDDDAEQARFRTIFKQYARSVGKERADLRRSLQEYIRFSPQSDALIADLIVMSVDHPSPGRLELGMDVLSATGEQTLAYAEKTLRHDFNEWFEGKSSKALQPDDDTWFILLRAVAQSEGDSGRRLSFVMDCSHTTRRGIAEAVVEALGDIDSAESRRELRAFIEDDDDKVIAELAKLILDDLTFDD